MAASTLNFDFSLCSHFELYYVVYFLAGILAGAIVKLWGTHSTEVAQPRERRSLKSRQLIALPASLMVLSLVMLSNHSASMLCHGAQLRNLTIFQKQRLVFPHMPMRGFRGSYRSPKGLRFPSPKLEARLEDTVFHPQALIDDAVVCQPFLSFADANDLVSPISIQTDDILDTALLSESQATSLRSLLSNLHNTGTFNRPSLVIDSGASISITDDLNDFISPPSPPQLSITH